MRTLHTVCILIVSFFAILATGGCDGNTKVGKVYSEVTVIGFYRGESNRTWTIVETASGQRFECRPKGLELEIGDTFVWPIYASDLALTTNNFDNISADKNGNILQVSQPQKTPPVDTDELLLFNAEVVGYAKNSDGYNVISLIDDGQDTRIISSKIYDEMPWETGYKFVMDMLPEEYALARLRELRQSETVESSSDKAILAAILERNDQIAVSDSSSDVRKVAFLDDSVETVAQNYQKKAKKSLTED